MLPVSLGEVAEATGGRLAGGADIVLSGVSTDTRAGCERTLFFAIEGERFDGHDFLSAAKAAGAAAAVVKGGKRRVREFAASEPGFPLVNVKDTVKALGDLAARMRERLDVKAVGITGSTGKTCTKDFLVSALSRRYTLAASKGSFNNEIGAPLTVLGAVADTDVLVAEMGARHSGDIARLAEIVKPDFGIITNIGVSHLELFGSIRAVAGAKSELAAALPEDGTLLLNADDRWTGTIAGRSKARVVRFGLGPGADFKAGDVRTNGTGRASFTLSGPGFEVGVKLAAVGAHQVENAVAAAACARILGMEPDSIVEGLESVTLSDWRMEVCETAAGVTVINDAYNANPRSVAASLKALQDAGRGRRKLAVLGEMAELGESSEKYHLQVGRELVKRGVDVLLAVGRRAAAYARAAEEKGMPKGSIFRCSDIARCVEVIDAILEEGDVVLVKGSRVVGLEAVARHLCSEAGRSVQRV